MKKERLGCALLAAALASGAEGKPKTPPPPSLAETRAIAKEAFVYGFPLVDAYRILYTTCVDRTEPAVQTPCNTLATASSDSSSLVGLDLRAEPLVFTIPAVAGGAPPAIQFVDLYTFHFASAGEHAPEHGAGQILLAGPRWRGETPPDVRLVRSETELAFAIVRSPQAGYVVQTLSKFLGDPAPPPSSATFMQPLGVEEEKKSVRFFEQLNFVLGFCPTHPSETALRARFGRLGIGTGKPFEARALSRKASNAVEDGIGDAWLAFADLQKKVQAGKVPRGELVGTRMHLKNDYLKRMYASVAGLTGLSPAHARER